MLKSYGGMDFLAKKRLFNTTLVHAFTLSDRSRPVIPKFFLYMDFEVYEYFRCPCQVKNLANLKLTFLEVNPLFFPNLWLKTFFNVEFDLRFKTFLALKWHYFHLIYGALLPKPCRAHFGNSAFGYSLSLVFLSLLS